MIPVSFRISSNPHDYIITVTVAAKSHVGSLRPCCFFLYRLFQKVL